MYKLFAVTAPGIEAITERELIGLGYSPSALSTLAGGVEFEGNLSAIYLANLQLRTANRVLVRLGTFRAVAFSELRKKASHLDWKAFITPGQTVAIRATCHKSKLYHSGGVAERIAGAIEDALGKPIQIVKASDEDASDPPQLVIVRLAHDECTISIDSSGELLHRRGYRQALAKAPLRETLAAAMVLSSEWDKTSPLIDPFCGSGVIAIEAAMIAKNIAPGLRRHFAFMQWKNFDKTAWQKLLTTSQTVPTTVPPIFASDRDAGAITLAQQNAERAGVATHIQFDTQAVSAIKASSPNGWIITNPPYGVRVSANKDVRNLYAQFGNVLRNGFLDWNVGVLCNDVALIKQIQLRLNPIWNTNNGGIPVSFSAGKVTVPKKNKGA